MKVFISYPSEQEKVAREIFYFLRSLGLDPWFDKEKLVAGQDWFNEIKSAQQDTDLTILVYFSETLDKKGVIQREIKEILDQITVRPFGHIYLVSIRTKELRLPTELAKYQYIDFFSQNWKIQLARSVELKLQQLSENIPIKLNVFLSTIQALEPRSFKYFIENTDLIDIEANYYIYNIDSNYWHFVNSVIISDVFNGIFRARAEFNQVSDLPFSKDMKNEWFVKVEEFFRSDELISLRFFVDWYGSGAAHPNHGIYTINLAGPRFGKFKLKDLLDQNDKYIRIIQRYCKLDLQRQHSNLDSEEDFLSFPKTDEESWDQFSEFNFDSEGITINFSPYAVLAYAYGPQTVHIPWKFLADGISPRFKNDLIRDILTNE